MGRKSKFSEKEWQAIGQRLLNGEVPAHIAKEFRIHPSQITRRFSQENAKIKDVANQLVEAERALTNMPIAQQICAISLAQRLRSISDHLASAAHYGAATAHRLSAIAHDQVQKVDDTNPEASMETLRGVATLTKMANEASVIGHNLLAANKGAPLDVPPAAPDFALLSDDELEMLETAMLKIK